MKIIDRDDFKMFVEIKDMKSPSDTKAVYFIREELDKEDNVLLTNTYEFFMNKDEIKALAKALNDYE